MQRKYIDLVVMLILITIGVVILILTSSTFKKIQPACKNKLLRTSLRVIMGIGSVLIALGFGYLVCFVRCDCYSEESSEPLFSNGPMLYFYAFLLLSIIMFAFSVIVNIELSKSKECDVSGKNDLKQDFIIISSVSGIYLLVAIIFGGLTWWKSYNLE